MPMTKKRRKPDKNKRKCLFEAKKKIQLDKLIENTISVDDPTIKKTKNGRIVDIKKEPIEENHLKVKSKPNSPHPIDESIKEKNREQSVDKSKTIEDIEEKSKVIEGDKEETSKSKSLTKTKQGYDKFIDEFLDECFTFVLMFQFDFELP